MQQIDTSELTPIAAQAVRDFQTHRRRLDGALKQLADASAEYQSIAREADELSAAYQRRELELRLRQHLLEEQQRIRHGAEPVAGPSVGDAAGAAVPGLVAAAAERLRQTAQQDNSSGMTATPMRERELGGSQPSVPSVAQQLFGRAVEAVRNRSGGDADAVATSPADLAAGLADRVAASRTAMMGTGASSLLRHQQEGRRIYDAPQASPGRPTATGMRSSQALAARLRGVGDEGSSAAIPSARDAEEPGSYELPATPQRTPRRVGGAGASASVAPPTPRRMIDMMVAQSPQMAALVSGRRAEAPSTTMTPSPPPGQPQQHDLSPQQRGPVSTVSPGSVVDELLGVASTATQREQQQLAAPGGAHGAEAHPTSAAGSSSTPAAAHGPSVLPRVHRRSDSTVEHGDKPAGEFQVPEAGARESPQTVPNPTVSSSVAAPLFEAALQKINASRPHNHHGSSAVPSSSGNTSPSVPPASSPPPSTSMFDAALSSATAARRMLTRTPIQIAVTNPSFGGQPTAPQPILTADPSPPPPPGSGGATPAALERTGGPSNTLLDTIADVAREREGAMPPPTSQSTAHRSDGNDALHHHRDPKAAAPEAPGAFADVVEDELEAHLSPARATTGAHEGNFADAVNGDAAKPSERRKSYDADAGASATASRRMTPLAAAGTAVLAAVTSVVGQRRSSHDAAATAPQTGGAGGGNVPLPADARVTQNRTGDDRASNGSGQAPSSLATPKHAAADTTTYSPAASATAGTTGGDSSRSEPAKSDGSQLPPLQMAQSSQFASGAFSAVDSQAFSSPDHQGPDEDGLVQQPSLLLAQAAMKTLHALGPSRQHSRVPSRNITPVQVESQHFTSPDDPSAAAATLGDRSSTRLSRVPTPMQQQQPLATGSPVGPAPSNGPEDDSEQRNAVKLAQARSNATIFSMLMRLRRNPTVFRSWKRRHVCVVNWDLLMYKEESQLKDPPCESYDLRLMRVDLAAEKVHGEKHTMILKYNDPVPDFVDREQDGGHHVILAFLNDTDATKWARIMKTAQKAGGAQAAVSKAVSNVQGTVSGAGGGDANSNGVRSGQASPANMPADPMPPGYERCAALAEDIEGSTDREILGRVTESISFFEPARAASLPTMLPLFKGREKEVFADQLRRHRGPPPSLEDRLEIFCARHCPHELEPTREKLRAAPRAKEYTTVLGPLFAKYNGGKEYSR